MAVESYTVKLDAFEGPLDLLLHLVRTNEVDIYHLPIAKITDQYLSYLSMFEELNLDVAGEYLLMAASLMYMKSRLLLPADEEDEGEDEEDPVGDLVRQLAEYQRYREAADVLRDRALLDRDVFRRDPAPPDDVEREEGELRPVELAELFAALRKVLTRAAARRPHSVSEEDYRVSDAVRTMVARLRGGARVTFSDLFTEDSPRGLIVATFLGLLELLKLGALEAEQRAIGAPIFIRLVDPDIDATLENLTDTYGAGAAGEAAAAGRSQAGDYADE